MKISFNIDRIEESGQNWLQIFFGSRLIFAWMIFGCGFVSYVIDLAHDFQIQPLAKRMNQWIFFFSLEQNSKKNQKRKRIYFWWWKKRRTFQEKKWRPTKITIYPRMKCQKFNETFENVCKCEVVSNRKRHVQHSYFRIIMNWPKNESSTNITIDLSFNRLKKLSSSFL